MDSNVSGQMQGWFSTGKSISVTCRVHRRAQPLWETAWQCLRKFNTKLPYDLAITWLDTHTKKTGYRDSNEYTQMFTPALFTRAKRWERPNARQQTVQGIPDT